MSPPRGRLLAALMVLGAFAWPLRAMLRPPLSRYVVDGASMEPAYHAGDRVLVNRLAYVRRAPAPGDVVLLRDPERRGHVLIKRVARPPAGVPSDAALVYVLGDNPPESRDSRHFGAVLRARILGKALLRY